MKKIKKIPTAARVIFIMTAICVCVHMVLYKSPSFADFFNSTAGYCYRLVTAKITEILPFSFAEFLLFSLPLILVVLCVLLCTYSMRSKVYFIRTVCFVLCIPAVIYCMFVTGFASGYRGATLDEKLSLNKKEVSAEELYHTAMSVTEELNASVSQVDFLPGGESVMPFSLFELSDKLCDAYDSVTEKYDFIDDYRSSVKPLAISKYMTYTHISGIYTFFTGEANINTNYPDYIVVYTAAHEMAHQRGISKEDEANFVAFLVCRESEDPYIRYCAALNMYQYLANALYETDSTLFSSVYYSLDKKVTGELGAYSRFFEKYRDSTASKVSDSLNEAYLKSQGTEGVKSYGMVVDLAVAYYEK
ncbi:MAG: DUF3810 domain-containing protein [Clostridia bacterium]|nr:DUF3810 domain-containing protein [Clostridia bacterium]